MATMALQQRLRARPAHPSGPTYLSYTPNGKKLITVGLNNAIRVFQSGSDAEPVTIDDCTDSNTAVDSTNTFFITGSEDGQVAKYSLESNTFEGLLFRSTLPVRDVAISPDGKWVAVASDELVVKVVSIEDMTKVLIFNEQPRAVKHVSFDSNGAFLSVSCSDGKVYIYSFGTDEPELITTVSNVIKNLDTNAEESSRVIWHPDARAFAAPTAGREVQVVSKDDWEKQRTFRSGHTGDITALAWSLNGALLATAGMDRRLVIWETKTQKILHTYNDIAATILDLQWHPTDNTLSYTNIDGELFIRPDVVPEAHASLLKDLLQPAPFIHDPRVEVNGNAPGRITNDKPRTPLRRKGSDASLDDIMEGVMSDDGYDNGDGFIDDDDGAGYTEQLNGNGKRTNGHLAPLTADNLKKRSTGSWKPQHHNSFQPGSTPWRGSRRYLCLNLTGAVWTVDQETHHSITVEFYDQDRRNFHFTDPFRYDKACLNDNGSLFSCQPSGKDPATLYYRPHETWTSRTDWRTSLPGGENIEAIALSDSFIVATTSANYVRVYTLFGLPYRVYRQKSSPTVSCAAWRDYIMTIGNGAIGADGRTRLQYTIENVKRDEVCQSEDTVALSDGADLRSVFFSDHGDPCIYDSTGVLLVLLHWRTPSQAKWVPLLDTKNLSRVASGRKTENYWPVAVASGRFYCIILKGAEQHPHLPVPLLSEFDFQVPLTSTKPSTELDATEGDTDTQRQSFEESFVRSSLLHSLQSDLLSNVHSTSRQRTELAKAELEIDKALLQLLNIECRAGEEHGMKALEIVKLLRNSNGTMLTAAEKIATRFGRDVLSEKIREEMERREVGLDDADE
ncbi:WD40 repeat-like protein [Pseudovirgaria hyperparasitica]|uniref:WD40 repeat-like protein n=1 Tax=Pseudovirgaria hyperparasitica TaxID=470096 RepID=A0A6A6W284_9PEZI|nr:WD40 repeat-like protein [Pseudovirgaria hyperparasitica]KAF2755697.1 WD40 repeat-like protein [Pseudovirgaria hyperparasitica]